MGNIEDTPQLQEKMTAFYQQRREQWASEDANELRHLRRIVAWLAAQSGNGLTIPIDVLVETYGDFDTAVEEGALRITVCGSEMAL